jgi:BirA family biotin operon repressor/biotin-[acetyl-CoA-carboxylase] ligase
MPDDLRRALEELRIRRPELTFDVRWLASLPSTMDVVAAAADAGVAAGFTVVADEQTTGRGRRGHRWSSPPRGGLYLSYLHRPQASVELVTLAAGVAVREAVRRSCGLAAQLKWPNDLLVGSRKLGGLLAEGAGIGTPDAAITIGVGLNLQPASYPPDVELRATCLAREISGAVDRGVVLAAIIEELHDTLARLDAGGGGDILQTWRAASPLSVGTPVTWRDATSTHHGLTAGLDDSGALLVRSANGLERIVGGELQWTLLDPDP